MSVDKQKLMAMLGNAKQVMNKVNSGDYKVDHSRVNETMANSGELLDRLPDGATPQTNAARPMGNTYQNLHTSKMPEHIKKAMVENPIPKMEMGSGGGPTFSLDDVRGLVSSTPNTNSAPSQAPSQQMNESYITNSKGQMLITLTEAELDKKINDALLEFMAKTFAKNLTETTIKKTISTLIKEGKIRVKQKQ